MTTKQTSTAAGLVIALGLVASAAFVPSLTQAAPPPIAVEVLTPRALFTDAVSGQLAVKLDGHATDVVNVKNPSRVVTAKITVQPGAQFPWHTHPGPVIVTVAEGRLTFVGADDCTERSYAAGEAFVDVGHGHAHTAFNRTGGVTVLFALFFEAPASGPLTITEGVPTPDDCQIVS